jgi:hypothetical protein
LLLAAVAKHRLLTPSAGVNAVQAGLGRSVGNWPDAAIARLRPDPPPGPMMNLPWSLANALIWYWPEEKVFVGSPLRVLPAGLPRRCLAIGARRRRPRSPAARARDPVDPRRALRIARRPPARALLASGAWEPVYADSLVVALVRRSAATEGYRATHRFAPAPDPPDLVPGPPALRARQRGCYEAIVRLCSRGAPAAGPH